MGPWSTHGDTWHLGPEPHVMPWPSWPKFLVSVERAWGGSGSFSPLLEATWQTSVPVVSPQVLNEDGFSSTIKDKILTIDVKPGWRQGTRITFEKEGDQVRGGLLPGASPPGPRGGRTEAGGGSACSWSGREAGLQSGRADPSCPSRGTEPHRTSPRTEWATEAQRRQGPAQGTGTRAGRRSES